MSLLAELRRRNVFRVAVAYLVFAWVLLQVADVLFPALRLPGWSITLVAVLLALGFVPALIAAWVFELTPDGLRRESEVDRSSSITRDTGRKLNIATILLVLVGIGLLAADRYFPGTGETGPDRPAADDGIPVIAILPFQATGSDDGGFLASGLHDDLLTMLHKLGAFRVLSRTSVMEYADTTKNLREIGAELGAGYILEGGVQAMGNRVRINAQLIDARTDEHLWADIYDNELTATNLFDVQARLASAIAEQLHRTLSPDDRAIVDDVPMQNTEAYDAYLRALEIQNREGLFSSRSAELLEQAVEADPSFANAWARLSEVRTRNARARDDPELRAAALNALAEARALKPDLLEAEIAWAVYLYHGQFEYGKALAALESLGERGERNPDVLQLKAWLYRRLGRYGDAYRTMLLSYQFDPRDPATIANLINMAFFVDDCKAAGDHAEAALELAPDSVEVRTHAATYELQCTGDAARASELMRGFELSDDWSVWTARIASWFQRDYERSLELADVPLPQSVTFGPVFNLLFKAATLSDLGRNDEAGKLLQRAGSRLAELAEDDTYGNTEDFAGAMLDYSSQRRDVAGTRHWIREHRQRERVETKNDVYDASFSPWWYARTLVRVGLYDDAIAELRAMLETPGGNTFTFVDATPTFDVLKDHPGYVELRERFGG